jgi:hypothetical protein
MTAVNVQEGKLDLNDRIDIADQSRAVLRSIRFGDAIRLIPTR